MGTVPIIRDKTSNSLQKTSQRYNLSLSVSHFTFGSHEDDWKMPCSCSVSAGGKCCCAAGNCECSNCECSKRCLCNPHCSSCTDECTKDACKCPAQGDCKRSCCCCR